MPVVVKKPVQLIAYQFDGTLECLRHIEILFPEILTMSINTDSDSRVSLWRLIFANVFSYEIPIQSVKIGDWIIKYPNKYLIYNNEEFVKTFDLVG